jgi:hypothetical protein
MQVALLSLAEADIVAGVCDTLRCLIVCNAHAKHALHQADGLGELVAVLMRGHCSSPAACTTAVQVLETILHSCTAVSVRMLAAPNPGALPSTGVVRHLLNPALSSFRHEAGQSAQLCIRNSSSGFCYCLCSSTVIHESYILNTKSHAKMLFLVPCSLLM